MIANEYNDERFCCRHACGHELTYPKQRKKEKERLKKEMCSFCLEWDKVEDRVKHSPKNKPEPNEED